MNIEIKIGKAKFSNPVTVASGTFGYIEKYCKKADIAKLGAIVPKTVTLYPQEGNPTPRIVETAAGMINAIGIANPGIDVFIKEKLAVLSTLNVPVIVSVSGKTEKEFVSLVTKLNIAGVSAVELNLSCPNLKKKILIAQDVKETANIVRSVKRISAIPVIAKLTPNVTDISLIAKAAEDAGADAVSLINTISAMAIDTRTRKPVLGNVSGGLSGPAIKPIALHMVYKTAQRVKIPIIAMGGIMNADDAIQFLIAGASMVAVGTASFVNPKAPLEVLQGIKDYMRKNKIKTIKEIIGSIQ